MRVAGMILLLLVVAACGNGENATNTEASKPYVPDFNSPEGASEAFARAIEGNNETLMQLVIAPEDREAAVPLYVGNIRRSKEAGIQWKIKFIESTAAHVSDTEVQSRVEYYQVEDGEEKLQSAAWAAFVQIDDGSWRFSARKTDKLNQQPKQPPDDGSEQPADDATPPVD